MEEARVQEAVKEDCFNNGSELGWKIYCFVSVSSYPWLVIAFGLLIKNLILWTLFCRGGKDGDVSVAEVKTMEIYHYSKRLHLGQSIASLEFCPSERYVIKQLKR